MKPRAWSLVTLVGLLLATLPAGDANTAVRTLTLDEAIRLAVQKSEGIVIERESLAAATASVDGARGAYDPLLGLDWEWARSTEPVNGTGAGTDPLAPEVEWWALGLGIEQRLPTGGALSLRGSGARETTDGPYARFSPAYSTRLGVELRQPLLRDRSIDASRLAVRVAQADRNGAAASLESRVSNTIAAVELTYWALASSRLGVIVREEAVRLANEQLSETRQRVASGMVPETEIAQPRAELERRRAELLAAHEAAARTQNTLKLQILGDADSVAWLDEIAPADSVPVAVTAVDVTGALARGLAARPELESAQAEIERRHAEAAFARNGVWPRLDAVASYDRFGIAGDANPAGPGGPMPAGGDFDESFDVLGDGDYDAARLALQLGLPIRNRSARADAAIARSAERQAEAERTRMRKLIRTQVLDAAAALETAGQRIEATRAGREAAEIQLDAEQDRYSTGLSTNFLVLTRQNDLSRARLDEISALTDYRMARAEMARATGSLIEERGIPWDDTQ